MEVEHVENDIQQMSSSQRESPKAMGRQTSQQKGERCLMEEAEVRARTVRQRREEVYATLQYAASSSFGRGMARL